MTNENWKHEQRFLPGGDKHESIKSDEQWERAHTNIRRIPPNLDRYYPDALHADDHTPEELEHIEGLEEE